MSGEIVSAWGIAISAGPGRVTGSGPAKVAIGMRDSIERLAAPVDPPSGIGPGRRLSAYTETP